MILRHPDPAVDLLLQRQAIHDVMVRYAAGIDRRDFELVSSCLAPDVEAAAWGCTSRDELVAFVSGVQHFHTTMHMMGNQRIDVRGDRATMDSYAMLMHRADPDAGGITDLDRSDSVYAESLVRTDEAWKIDRHVGEPRWSTNDLGEVEATDGEVRWLLDRAALYDLMVAYALGLDERDFDRVGACFANEFHATYGPMGEFDDLDSLLSFIRGVARFPSTTHFLGTHVAEVDGDSGRMETYALITHREHEKPEWTVGGSGYRDEVVREGGRWLIAERGERAGPVAAAPPRDRRSDDPAVQYLLDRAAIRDLIATSVLSIDRRDWVLFEACHAGHSNVALTRAAVRRSPFSMHLVNNDLVEIDGDRATAETYAFITHRDGPFATPSPWAEGARRIVDHLERGPDGWRILERAVLDNRVERAMTA